MPQSAPLEISAAFVATAACAQAILHIGAVQRHLFEFVDIEFVIYVMLLKHMHLSMLYPKYNFGPLIFTMHETKMEF